MSQNHTCNDIQVAQVVSVEPVENSDKLWLCQVDVGEEKPRQVVAGLQQYVPREVMQGLQVVAICNLKPAKLAGQLSEAMILAASCMEGETRIVKTLQVPQGSSPGDKVCCRPYRCMPVASPLRARCVARSAWCSRTGHSAAAPRRWEAVDRSNSAPKTCACRFLPGR
jgi:methionine--tRNA ligase beta chain